jgi:hypothetical protein
MNRGTASHSTLGGSPSTARAAKSVYLRAEMLDVCERYVVDRRWHLHPMRDDKKPLTPHGYYDATTDLNTVREWLERWPEASMALACGKSEVVIVDVDPRNGGDASFESLLDETTQELLKAPSVVTPGGGRHLYFAAPKVKVKGGPLHGFPGIDILSAGFSAILPYSVRGDRRYEWDGDDLSLPPFPLPPALLSRLRTRPVVREAFENHFTQGTRNVGLVRIAGVLRRQGYDCETLTDVLNVINRRSCKPPLDDREVAQIAGSVSSYAPAFDPMSFVCAWNREDLTQREMRICVELARLADASGACSPPISELVTKTGIDRRGCFRVMEALCERGVVKRENRRRSLSSIYHLRHPHDRNEAPDSGRNDH